jgi:hypothetical protein
LVEVAQFALEQLDLEIDNVKFYTDSKVVLGYISNEIRRFFVYVGNRVERIRKFSTPKQWNYVPTDCNPADSATRTLQAHEIHSSKWLLGPTRSVVPVRTVQLLQLELLHTIPSEEWNVPWEVQVLPFQERIQVA